MGGIMLLVVGAVLFGIGIGLAIGKEGKEKIPFWHIAIILFFALAPLILGTIRLQEPLKPHMQIHTLAELAGGSVYYRSDTMSTSDYIHLVRENEGNRNNGILLYTLNWKNYGLHKNDIPNRFMPHWTPEGNLELITLPDKKQK